MAIPKDKQHVGDTTGGYKTPDIDEKTSTTKMGKVKHLNKPTTSNIEGPTAETVSGVFGKTVSPTSSKPTQIAYTKVTVTAGQDKLQKFTNENENHFKPLAEKTLAKLEKVEKGSTMVGPLSPGQHVKIYKTSRNDNTATGFSAATERAKNGAKYALETANAVSVAMNDPSFDNIKNVRENAKKAILFAKEALLIAKSLPSDNYKQEAVKREALEAANDAMVVAKTAVDTADKLAIVFGHSTEELRQLKQDHEENLKPFAEEWFKQIHIYADFASRHETNSKSSRDGVSAIIGASFAAEQSLSAVFAISDAIDDPSAENIKNAHELAKEAIRIGKQAYDKVLALPVDDDNRATALESAEKALEIAENALNTVNKLSKLIK